MDFKSDSYSLFDDLDRFMTRPRFEPNTDTSHFYPSEASVEFYDQFGDLTVEGKCLRASYFRIVGGFEKLPIPAYTQYIFDMGKMIEQMLVNRFKEMGVWVDNNIKFYNKEWNVSGEIDILLAEPPHGVIYPAEIKSCYGYFAEKEIFGNKSQKGQPKLGQLLQLLVYLNEFRNQFPYGRMIYFFRDSTKRKTFKVQLYDEGNITYPVVEGSVMRQFTINDILKRYKKLQFYIDSNQVPPADYELQYNEAKIHDFAAKGKVGKTKYGNWKAGKLKDYEYIGDWNCSWCPYLRECYGENVVLPPVYV